MPATPLDLSLRLACSLANWAVAVPLPRYSYADVGVRPFDAANGSFTLELWAQASGARGSVLYVGRYATPPAIHPFPFVGGLALCWWRPLLLFGQRPQRR